MLMFPMLWGPADYIRYWEDMRFQTMIGLTPLVVPMVVCSPLLFPWLGFFQHEPAK